MRKQILDLQLRHWLYPGWDLQEKLRWHQESGLSVRAPRFATMRTSIALRRPSWDWGIVWKLQFGAPSLWCEIEVWKKALDCYGGERNGRVFACISECVLCLYTTSTKCERAVRLQIVYNWHWNAWDCCKNKHTLFTADVSWRAYFQLGFYPAVILYLFEEIIKEYILTAL